MYFSICIPAYNRADTISRTLDSLIRQSFTDFEVIIVDDGSKDNTREVVSSYKPKLNIKYNYKENGGKHTALNRGISEAQGIFFMILDSDDWLVDNGLEIMHDLCEKIVGDDRYSGVLCRCINLATNKIMGDDIPRGYESLSYIDMHFRLRHKGIELGDCCECNKTSILKKYRFPEEVGMKFVPEAYIFDQIGVHYKLLSSNQGIKICEYLEGGITLDKQFKRKNNTGYLYHYISRIENILPNIEHTKKDEVIAWWRYWDCVNQAPEKEGPRVNNISKLGYFVKACMPLLNTIYRVRYKDIYRSGR